MDDREPLTHEDGEVRELTAEDRARFGPSAGALPPSLQEKIATRTRGHQRAPTKERITIRLSREVIESFRATGAGWQGRVDAALKEWLRTHRIT